MIVNTDSQANHNFCTCVDMACVPKLKIQERLGNADIALTTSSSVIC